MTNAPTPAQARELLQYSDAAQWQAKSADAWPVVVLEGMLGASLSIAALGQLSEERMLLAGAALLWLIPALLIYLLKAKGWQRGTAYRFIPFLIITVAAFALAAAFAPDGHSWVAFAGAAVIFVLTPLAALLELAEGGRSAA